MNDPFECCPGLSVQKAQKIIHLHSAQNPQFQGITIDPNLAIRRLMENTSNSFDNLGIFSLSERWNNGLMWSHYAQSHQGFCIGFSKESLIAKFPKNYLNEQMSSNLDPLVPVIYSASRAEPALAKDGIASPEVFYTKSLDWKYEQEWRLFANLANYEEGKKEGKDSKGREICLLKVPHYSIAEIIIGLAAKDELNPKIIDFARSKKLPVYKTVLPVETFCLHREKVLLS